MTLDTALLDRCVRAYMAVEWRKRGHEYQGPCVDDLLVEAGFRNDVAYHRACTAIVEEAARRLLEAEPPEQADGHRCECGRRFSSHRGLRNHLKWCEDTDGLADCIIEMREDGATYAEITAALQTNPNRVVAVLREHRERAA